MCMRCNLAMLLARHWIISSIRFLRFCSASSYCRSDWVAGRGWPIYFLQWRRNIFCSGCVCWCANRGALDAISLRQSIYKHNDGQFAFLQWTNNAVVTRNIIVW